MGSDREESRGVSRIFTRRTRNLASVRNIVLVRKSYLSFLLLFFLFFLTLFYILSFSYTVKSSLFFRNLCVPVTFVSLMWFLFSSFPFLFFFLYRKKIQRKSGISRKEGEMAKIAAIWSMVDTFLILSPPKIVVFVFAPYRPPKFRIFHDFLDPPMTRKIATTLSKLFRCTLRIRKRNWTHRTTKSSFFRWKRWKKKKIITMITTRNTGSPNFCLLYYTIGWNR